MDAEERLDTLINLLNQAGDLAEALLKPFAIELANHDHAVLKAARTLQGTAKKLAV